MNNIESTPGKLLYTVYHMFKENTIDTRSKIILKDLIITRNPHVIAAFEDYQARGTQLTLKSDLFRILNQEKQAQKKEGLSDKSLKSRGGKIMKITVPPKNITVIPQYIRQS